PGGSRTNLNIGAIRLSRYKKQKHISVQNSQELSVAIRFPGVSHHELIKEMICDFLHPLLLGYDFIQFWRTVFCSTIDQMPSL
ncbi:MAG TPA: hypothetical protein VIS72_04650, partial [Anaerolineales bacterium]